MNRPLRLAHVVPSYLPARRYGGPIYAVHGLCRALAARGHQVDVYTTSIDGDSESDVSVSTPVDLDGVQVRYFRPGLGRRLFRAPALVAALRTEIGSYDLVHTHSLFLWPPAAAAAAARAAGVPYVISPRGMLVKQLVAHKSRLAKSVWLALVDRPNLEQAAAVHFTSAVEEHDAGQFGYRLPRSLLVPNGIDVPDPGTAPGQVSAPVSAVLGKHPLITHLGRVHWKKGLDTVLRALPSLPAVHFAVAGNDEEGIEPRLRALASALGVADRVHWLGPVGPDDKQALLKGSDLFVLMSLSENFGNAALEAAAAGCPAVLSPEVGVAAALAEGGAAVIVERDAAVLAQAISDLLETPERRRVMGAAGERLGRERFAWPVVAAGMEVGYRAVLGTDPDGWRQ